MSIIQCIYLLVSIFCFVSVTTEPSTYFLSSFIVDCSICLPVAPFDVFLHCSALWFISFFVESRLFNNFTYWNFLFARFSAFLSSCLIITFSSLSGISTISLLVYSSDLKKHSEGDYFALGYLSGLIFLIVTADFRISIIIC